MSKRLLSRVTSVLSTVMLLLSVLAGTPVGSCDPEPPHRGSDSYYQPYTNDFSGMEGAWTAEKDGPLPHEAVHIDWDVPITMSDGTVLKANVYRPMDAGGVVVDRLPVVLNFTPYTKWLMAVTSKLVNAPGIWDGILRGLGTLESSDPALKNFMQYLQMLDGGQLQILAPDKRLIRSGYIWIDVDVRGTGFSEGKWEMLSSREQQDSVEVIDWASKQEYADGKVGLTGYSYHAITGLRAAALRPPALKAVFAGAPAFDLMQDFFFRGGALNAGFIPSWSWLVNGLKRVPDVQSLVEGTFQDKYAQWIADRDANPTVFSDVLYAWLNAKSVEELVRTPEVLELFNPESARRKALLTDMQAINVPTFIVGGWSDLLRNGQFRAYEALAGLKPGEKQMLIGINNHITAGNGLGKPDAPPRLDVIQKAWFDHWLKGIDNEVEKLGPVLEQMPGAQGWQRISALPRPGMQNQRMYLDSAISGTAARTQHDGSLSANVPTGTDDLSVRVGLASLCSSLTNAQFLITSILMVCDQDERTHEIDGLTFTSQPVSVPTVISGPIAVHLNTKHEGTDGFWMASVSDVDPDNGNSYPLTSGWVVSSMRKVDEKRSKRGPNGDYTDPIQALDWVHGYMPTVPGQPTTVDFGTYPLDAVLQPGHRLRVSIYANNYPTGVPSMPSMINAGLTPPPYEPRDLALLFTPDNTFYPEHLSIDPAAPSWVSIPGSDPLP